MTKKTTCRLPPAIPKSLPILPRTKKERRYNRHTSSCTTGFPTAVEPADRLNQIGIRLAALTRDTQGRF